MREYMTNLGTVLMITSLSSLILPEGGIKKFAALAMGFLLISAALSFLPLGGGEFSFSASSFEINEEELALSEAKYKAQVLKEHRKNLEQIIDKEMKHGSKSYVEVSPEGEILSVTIKLKGDESAAVAYVTKTLKVPRERIYLNYDKN